MINNWPDNNNNRKILNQYCGLDFFLGGTNFEFKGSQIPPPPQYTASYACVHNSLEITLKQAADGYMLSLVYEFMCKRLFEIQ